MRKRGLTVAVVMTVIAGAITAVALAAAPTATTGDPSIVTATGATLGGTVNAGGETTTVAFDYGTSTAYGRSSSTTTVSGSTTTAVSLAISSGLSPATTYHYRIAASNGSGTAAGADRTFTTAAVPTVGSVTTSSITSSGAGVSSSVNPHGQATQVVFDYGTTTRYGQTTAPQSIGSGTAAVTVRATLTGLSANTTYHVRARAVAGTWTTNGADRSFKTSAAQTPQATTASATAVLPRQATLNGNATPRGSATSAYFEYGTSTAYGARSVPAQIGSGASAVPLATTVTGLQPNTTYHFRVVASNGAGTVRGADRSFKTPAPPTLGALTASKKTVAYGRATAISGTVGGAGAGTARWSLLYIPYPFKGASLLKSGATAASGALRIVTKGLRQRALFVVSVDAAGETLRSPILRVNVRPAVVWSYERVSGGRIRFSGRFRPGVAATVYLRKVGKTSAVTVGRVRARPDGESERTFSITIKAPRARSIYRIRVAPDTKSLVSYSSANRAVAARR